MKEQYDVVPEVNHLVRVLIESPYKIATCHEDCWTDAAEMTQIFAILLGSESPESKIFELKKLFYGSPHTDEVMQESHSYGALYDYMYEDWQFFRRLVDVEAEAMRRKQNSEEEDDG